MNNLKIMEDYLAKNTIDYITFKKYYNYLIEEAITTKDIENLLPYFITLRNASIIITDDEVHEYHKRIFIIDNLCMGKVRTLIPNREDMLIKIKKMREDLNAYYISFSLFNKYFYTLELYFYLEEFNLSSLIKTFLKALVVTNSYEEERKYLLINQKLSQMLREVESKKLTLKK